MTLNKKALIHKLLKGIETGDPESATVVNEAKYIQHNPQTNEGSEGLAALFKRLSKSNPKVNLPRIFEDGDFVFAHTEYDFASRNIGFEIFRFEEGKAVEHWDNIQARKGPNVSGHSMVDGETEVIDRDLTEANRSFIDSFIQEVLIAQHLESLTQYIDAKNYMEHSPNFSDDLGQLTRRLTPSNNAEAGILYRKCHRLLAEGNFVLSVCEGIVDNEHSSLFDLYRLRGGKIIEHWDTTEILPARSEWKNNNGKF